MINRESAERNLIASAECLAEFLSMRTLDISKYPVHLQMSVSRFLESMQLLRTEAVLSLKRQAVYYAAALLIEAGDIDAAARLKVLVLN